MSHTFVSEVLVEGKTATYVEVPLDIDALFGRARPPVTVTINDHTYRSTIAVYGGRYFLPLNRANRERAGVAAGDEVEVTIAADTAERRIEVPEDLRAAFSKHRKARTNFEGLSYSHKRSYVEWIEEAKRPDTRARRIDQTIEGLTEGRTPS
ncbi:MAG TPA: YdeI/OmpD-associated family protein [Actinomycetota bacterium]|nr:YdeI/OmpD-associated family protein [Actinomycetota bacterium]